MRDWSRLDSYLQPRKLLPLRGVDAARVAGLVEAVKSDKHHVKAVKPLPSRKINRPVPLTDCFIAPVRKAAPSIRISPDTCSWQEQVSLSRLWRLFSTRILCPLSQVLSAPTTV